jgi:hypothetical protein
MVRTDGDLGWRLELQDVPSWSDVEIHLGNYPKNTKGCLLPGLDAPVGTCAVSHSAQAMTRLRELFAAFGESGETTITVDDGGDH